MDAYGLAPAMLADACAAPLLGATQPPPIAMTPAERAQLQAQADRAKNIAAQISLFIGIGLLLSAFVACVAAAIGGLRRDEMHVTFHTQAEARGGCA